MVSKLRTNPLSKYLKIPGILCKLQRILEEEIEPSLNLFYDTYKDKEHIFSKLNVKAVDIVSSKVVKFKAIRNSEGKDFTPEVLKGRWSDKQVDMTQTDISVFSIKKKKTLNPYQAPKYHINIDNCQIKILPPEKSIHTLVKKKKKIS